MNRACFLPATKSYDFKRTLPSLVAAYEISGDAKNFRSIEEANPSQWPFAIGPVVGVN
jgi:hypothetical protein